MRKEITFEEALEYTKSGKEVEVIVPENEQSYRKVNMSEIYSQMNNCIFLIDSDDIEDKSSKGGSVEKIHSQFKSDRPVSNKARSASIDIGKLMALRKGHWKISDIAEELHVSVATVNKYLKKIRDGEIYAKGTIDGYDEPEQDSVDI